MKIRDKLAAIRRARPIIGPDRYLYAAPADLSKRGKTVRLYLIVRSSDGRVSLHLTDFEKSVRSRVWWGEWLIDNAPEVLINSVLPYLNRTFGSIWSVERVIGWHFARK